MDASYVDFRSTELAPDTGDVEVVSEQRQAKLERTKPLKVVFVTRKWFPAMGGMETYCVRLAKHLASLVDLTVIAVPGRADGRPPALLPLLLLPLRVIAALLRKKHRPNVLHLSDMAVWPIGWLARILYRTPQIAISAHGTDAAYGRRKTVRGLMYRLYLRAGSSLLPNAIVIANSRATREVLRETGWDAAGVVRLGTDIRPSEELQVCSRKLLFCGRIIPMKGLGWFVREVLPKLPSDIDLEVAGTIWDREEADVLQHSRVTHVGHFEPEQMPRIYRQAMGVIVPNIDVDSGEYEGFGLVAAEAAAAGGVVLAAKRDGLIDAVVDRQTGFLLESGDAEAWASEIMRVRDWTADERTAFISNATKVAAREYSWERVASETNELYVRALANA